jgi:DNA-binding NarL/FixJ family response regulator
MYKMRKSNRQSRKREKRFKEPLSRREWEVVVNLSYGKTHKQIGTELFIATTTVSKHIQNVMRDMDIDKETLLSRRVTELQNGIIPFRP